MSYYRDIYLDGYDLASWYSHVLDTATTSSRHGHLFCATAFSLLPSVRQQRRWYDVLVLCVSLWYDVFLWHGICL